VIDDAWHRTVLPADRQTIGAQGGAGVERYSGVLYRFLTVFFAAASGFFHFYLALLFARLQAGWNFVTITRSNHSPRPMPDTSSAILDELEASLASGNVQHRLNVLQRVTDLFVAGSSRYSGVEIALFDDVLSRLIAEIETEARARLSQRLATLANAPPGLIRRLAFDDAIQVAAPVLSGSPQLTDADLVENAACKSQEHLYAIAQRLKLSEAVTDVLIERGNRKVVSRVARNNGAQFSFKTYERLVRHARDDRRLVLTIGRRNDIPRQCFLKLLENASAEVRRKLEAMNPQAAREIRETVAEVAETMQREVRDASRGHQTAARDARHLFRSHRLSEANVHAARASSSLPRRQPRWQCWGRFRSIWSSACCSTKAPRPSSSWPRRRAARGQPRKPS
jgi:uncharacterized protein (DUF2336 family)